MEFTGKTVDEAIENGLRHFGITKEDAEITVVSEEVKGLFGKVKKDAVVDVKSTLHGGKRAIKFLDGLFDLMGIVAKAQLKDEDDAEKTVIEIITDASPAVIGYRGEVLDALQSMAGAVANIDNEEYKRVVVDCEGYRAKREETLIRLANKLADKAVRFGRDVALEPMNPYERRIIHSALSENKNVTTASEGKEPNRHVVIVPNEKKPSARGDRPFNAGGSRGNGRGDRRGGGRGDKRRDGGHGAKKEPRKTPGTFGAYIGNSIKNDDGE